MKAAEHLWFRFCSLPKIWEIFLNKAEYVATISKYDRSMLEELQQVRANVEKKQKDLEEQQSKLSGLQETLTSKRDELNSKDFIHFRRTGKLSGTVGSCQSCRGSIKACTE